MAENGEGVNAREAVSKAKDYLKEMLGIYPNDAKLEEIELSDDGIWIITLSYKEGVAFSGIDVIKYKIIEIEADTGEVISMKIRKV